MDDEKRRINRLNMIYSLIKENKNSLTQWEVNFLHSIKLRLELKKDLESGQENKFREIRKKVKGY